MKDYYYILGVEAGCTPTDLDTAYLKLSDKLKPDDHTGDPFITKRFNEIKEAYAVLSSPVRRSWYDEERNLIKPLPAKEQRRVKRYHSTTKGVNMALTAVLSVMAVILGYYVYKVMHSTKPAVANIQAAVVKQLVHKIKWHKHRAKKSFLYHAVTPKSLPVVAKTEVKKPLVNPLNVADAAPKIKPAAISPVPSAPAPQQSTDIHPAVTEKGNIGNNQGDSYNHNNDYLYITYLKANQTGVVRLRETANYNADVITSVPTNAKVFVLERGALYYKIRIDNTIGYVPKWTVQEK